MVSIWTAKRIKSLPASASPSISVEARGSALPIYLAIVSTTAQWRRGLRHHYSPRQRATVGD